MTTTTTTPAPTGHPVKRQRDQRLDFFRGVAMFIILLAHTPGNTWTLWIPARFGFSDATEIFVFCSGMASAMAFGAVFAGKSFLLGTARICFRIWQVYWAHIGTLLVCALLLVLLDRTGMGEADKVYANWPSVAPLWTRSQDAFVGLFTLTWVPGLFDILPMYLVILALVPVVMAVFRAGGREAVFAFCGIVWLMAQFAGYARTTADATDLGMMGETARWLGQHLLWMNFTGSPWGRATWFFNPFGWQLVFFTGFAFGMGWLRPPPVTRTLVIVALAVVLFTVPFAWHKITNYYTGYLPEAWGGALFWEARDHIGPLRWKTWVGGWRYVHFLAIAYLAWAAVGPGGIRLNSGWTAPAPARGTVLWVAVAVMLVTIPYTYIDTIAALSPALDAWVLATLPLAPANQLGLLQIAHLVALVIVVWAVLTPDRRVWLARDGWLCCVPVIRKVGTQSLAVFVVSIVLSRFNGWWLDVIGRDVWTLALVNLTGFAVLIGVAYGVGWLRRQPWRDRPATNAAPAPRASVPAE